MMTACLSLNISKLEANYTKGRKVGSILGKRQSIKRYGHLMDFPVIDHDVLNSFGVK